MIVRIREFYDESNALEAAGLSEYRAHVTAPAVAQSAVSWAQP